MNKEEKVIEYLKKEYDAEAIVFLGSRAVGDFKPRSDWDVLLLTDKKNIKDERYTKGKYGLQDEDFDLYIYPTNVKFSFEKFGLKLRFNKIVYDPKKLGKRLINSAMKFYSKGPKVTKEWCLGRKDKATRYMKKFEDNLNDKKEEELFLRICWHYSENIIDWWFRFRKEWPLRPQQAFDYIKKKDPRFYFQLKRVYSDKTSYSNKINAFKKMHEMLFNSKGYKRLVK
ncbi:MAG: nucleotidyltransferase domain-containing protein [Candidatus Heimdallarchaeaceae archaeon]